MTTILIVDDSAFDRTRVSGILKAKEPAWQLQFAENGLDALEKMAENPADVIITDLQMPEMDGLKLVTEVREKFPFTPVVLMTSHGSEEIAIEALHLGASHYSPKKNLQAELVTIIKSVLAASSAKRGHARLKSRMTQSHTEFSLENDSTLIPPLIQFLQESVVDMGLCDEKDRTRVGIALEESLANALYHGNLEVGSELRERDDGAYYNLIQERLSLSPYKERRLFVSLTQSPEQAVFCIRDEGPGFDPKSLPDPTDPANLEKVSGRGLLLIRTFMDEINHNDAGNEITMIKRPSETVAP